MRAPIPAPTTVDAYIAGFPAEVQTLLERVRAAVRRAAPGATEAVKYRIPTFVLGRNLVHFGAFKSHIGFYPTASGIRRFKVELAAYNTARGSVQFPFDRPIPYNLIGRIVRFRVQEERARAAAGGKKPVRRDSR